jgi:hypothetical protein
MIDLELLAETPKPTRRVKANLRCTVHEFTKCGQTSLLHVRLLLTQHFSHSGSKFRAAMQPASRKRPFKATISVDFRPTFRGVLFELTHRGLS